MRTLTLWMLGVMMLVSSSIAAEATGAVHPWRMVSLQVRVVDAASGELLTSGTVMLMGWTAPVNVAHPPVRQLPLEDGLTPRVLVGRGRPMCALVVVEGFETAALQIAVTETEDRQIATVALRRTSLPEEPAGKRLFSEEELQQILRDRPRIMYLPASPGDP